MPELLRDAWRLNVDLHSHSCHSDGTLAPAEVVARAHDRGVRLLALTDHDELSGLDEAAAAARALGMAFLPGVEISVTWAHETLHVLGLGIDPRDPALVAGLARLRAGREVRAREIAEGLERAGVSGAYEGARRYAANPELVSRAHFARYLVEQGVCSEFREVFGRFLVAGKPGYVPHQWARLSEAVAWIRGAGGVAVLAHPGRYRLDVTAGWAMLGEFREAGGTGIEVVCGSHTRDQYRLYASRAREFDLRASRGSDFHSPDEGHVDLGRLPPLPDSVVPMWIDWPLAARAEADA